MSTPRRGLKECQVFEHGRFSHQHPTSSCMERKDSFQSCKGQLLVVSVAPKQIAKRITGVMGPSESREVGGGDRNEINLNHGKESKPNTFHWCDGSSRSLLTPHNLTDTHKRNHSTGKHTTIHTPKSDHSLWSRTVKSFQKAQQWRSKRKWGHFFNVPYHSRMWFVCSNPQFPGKAHFCISTKGSCLTFEVVGPIWRARWELKDGLWVPTKSCYIH